MRLNIMNEIGKKILAITSILLTLFISFLCACNFALYPTCPSAHKQNFSNQFFAGILSRNGGDGGCKKYNI